MNRQSGITLVEIIVTAAISSVLAASILSILFMNTAQTKESIATQRLQQAYEIASEAIHRKARTAYTVRGDDEVPWPTSTPLTSPRTSMSKIVFYNKAGAITGGFRANSDGYLVEITPGGEQLFLVGGLPLTLLNPNKFTITAYRRSIQFHMDISMVLEGETHTLATPREIVLCRNNDN